MQTFNREVCLSWWNNAMIFHSVMWKHRFGLLYVLLCSSLEYLIVISVVWCSSTGAVHVGLLIRVSCITLWTHASSAQLGCCLTSQLMFRIIDLTVMILHSNGLVLSVHVSNHCVFQTPAQTPACLHTESRSFFRGLQSWWYANRRS